MSRKYKFHNPDGVYFITFAVQGWVDVFTRNLYKDIIIDNLAFCQKNKGLELFSWCLMTNHLHLIALASESNNLPKILRDFKKFTSKAVLKAIAENDSESRKDWLLYQFKTEDGNRFWRAVNKPIELWSNAVIDQKLNYIHQNPVEEGLVFNAEDYVYSSATDYAGRHGLLDIFVIDSKTRLGMEKIYKGASNLQYSGHGLQIRASRGTLHGTWWIRLYCAGCNTRK